MRVGLPNLERRESGVIKGKRLRPLETGERFGRLTVLAKGPKLASSNHGRYACICDCGRVSLPRQGYLLNGKVRSCGCVTTRTHGKRHTPEYTVWAGMKDRCLRPNSQRWKHYGGRGITVCDRWKDSFENFLADMGPKPTPEHSIDRVDNNGNYEPSNCRWATHTEQSRNRRTNLLITYRGQTKSLGVWCALLGLERGTVKHRLRTGWTLDEAFQTPVKKHWTHCKRGHEYTAENTIRNDQGRICRTCYVTYQRAYNVSRRKQQS